MPVYTYTCKCGWTGEFIKPVHKRDHICPECKTPLKPRIGKTERRWGKGGRP